MRLDPAVLGGELFADALRLRRMRLKVPLGVVAKVAERGPGRQQGCGWVVGLERGKGRGERQTERARHDGMPWRVGADQPPNHVVGDRVIGGAPDAVHEDVGHQQPRDERGHDCPRTEADRMLLHPRQGIDPLRRRGVEANRQFDAERLHVRQRQDSGR